MKRIGISLLSCAVAWNVPSQTAAPNTTSLAAYADSLQAPARVATDAAGNVYVTDPQAGRVIVFDTFGRQSALHAGLGQPLGIAVDVQGHVFLADEQTGSVSVFDAQWTPLYKLGAGDGEFQLPNYIALGPASDSAAVYVSDSRANAIKVYRGQSLIQRFGSPGAGLGQFDFPAGLCVSTLGEVFVVDQNNDRVQVFDPAGNFLRSFDLGSSKPAGRSQGALLDQALRLYVADAFQGTVKVFDSASGTALSTIGSFGQLAGQLSSPGGLALDPFGRLCVASVNNGRLELYGLDSFVHLSANPATAIIAAGTNLVFSATTGGNGPFAFQWQKDGQAISGATNASLTINGVGFANAGSYAVVVTSASGMFTSSLAQVTVMAPPVLLSGPQSQTVLRGTDVVLAVQAAGTALNYQWRLNGLDVADATYSTLRLPNVQAHQAGDYSVVVRNSVGSLVTPTASLAVLTPPSLIEILSASAQTDLLFHLTVNVDPGFTYTLEASTNLADWQALTNFVNDAGLVELIDADSTNFWNRFYRVHWLP